MYGLKFSWQNVCTVNVHEMYYRFNPGPSPNNNCCVRQDINMAAPVNSLTISNALFGYF